MRDAAGRRLRTATTNTMPAPKPAPTKSATTKPAVGTEDQTKGKDTESENTPSESKPAESPTRSDPSAGDGLPAAGLPAAAGSGAGRQGPGQGPGPGQQPPPPPPPPQDGSATGGDGTENKTQAPASPVLPARPPSQPPVSPPDSSAAAAAGGQQPGQGPGPGQQPPPPPPPQGTEGESALGGKKEDVETVAQAPPQGDAKTDDANTPAGKTTEPQCGVTTQTQESSGVDNRGNAHSVAVTFHITPTAPECSGSGTSGKDTQNDNSSKDGTHVKSVDSAAASTGTTSKVSEQQPEPPAEQLPAADPDLHTSSSTDGKQHPQKPLDDSTPPGQNSVLDGGNDDPPPLNPPKPKPNPNPDDEGSRSGASDDGKTHSDPRGGREKQQWGGAMFDSGSTGGSSGFHAPWDTTNTEATQQPSGPPDNQSTEASRADKKFGLNLTILPGPNSPAGGFVPPTLPEDTSRAQNDHPGGTEKGPFFPDLTDTVLTATTPILFFLTSVIFALLGYSLWKVIMPNGYLRHGNTQDNYMQAGTPAAPSPEASATTVATTAAQQHSGVIAGTSSAGHATGSHDAPKQTNDDAANIKNGEPDFWGQWDNDTKSWDKDDETNQSGVTGNQPTQNGAGGTPAAPSPAENTENDTVQTTPSSPSSTNENGETGPSAPTGDKGDAGNTSGDAVVDGGNDDPPPLNPPKPKPNTNRDQAGSSGRDPGTDGSSGPGSTGHQNPGSSDAYIDKDEEVLPEIEYLENEEPDFMEETDPSSSHDADDEANADGSELDDATLDKVLEEEQLDDVNDEDDEEHDGGDDEAELHTPAHGGQSDTNESTPSGPSPLDPSKAATQQQTQHNADSSVSNSTPSTPPSASQKPQQPFTDKNAHALLAGNTNNTIDLKKTTHQLTQHILSTIQGDTQFLDTLKDLTTDLSNIFF
ncbi:hypothetical protein AK88_02856 [Plasmodium fragile]|uniref:CD99 antigen n=1 Tax=Plasmodium fragile TaxID=5857 RepID=A0A0D9QL66_PLAFR|nr:uncharacterized protein AK88_02856 [Plasmodium fragile]KJP87552.1 hypothetical protein AK88_02856 [Plasmodium fragile]